MKKVLSMAMVLLMLLGAFGVAAFAEDGTARSASVYVTISDGTGKLALIQEKITVTDADGDGALTIHDALVAAHEAKYEGGAAAGYAASVGTYGLAIDKLWGAANGGSYGYYINNASAWNLTDPVRDGDYINAMVYVGVWPDMESYCYFDPYTVSGKEGDTVTLTLSVAGYDENYNPVAVPVEGATITLDGVATAVKTDAGGQATVTLEKSGTVVISAISETQKLIPPACVATVEAVTPATDDTAPVTGSDNAEPKPGKDMTAVIVCAVLAVAVVAVAIVAVVVMKRKKNG